MKNSFIILLLSSTIYLFISCKKETSTAEKNGSRISVADNDSSDPILACLPSPWQGIYSTPNKPDQSPANNSFISSGVAQLKNGPSGYIWTTIKLPLNFPYCQHPLNGDNFTFEVKLKNPTGTGSVPSYDVSLFMTGTSNTAGVTFIGEDFRRSFTQLKVGNTGVSNVSELVVLFQNWSTIKLQSVNGTLSVYVNDVLKKSINYSGLSIGTLNDFRVMFKGSGVIEWIKVKSVNADTGIGLLENFDFYGQSHQIWSYF